MAMRISVGVTASVARAARLVPPSARAAQHSGYQTANSSLRTFGSASSSFLRSAGASFARSQSHRKVSFLLVLRLAVLCCLLLALHQVHGVVHTVFARDVRPFCVQVLASTGVFAWGRGFMQQAKTELAPKTAPAGQDIATFAGGCFWGLELAFQREPGVTHTSVGYTQGSVEAPGYQAVCGGGTGHAEAVQVSLMLVNTLQLSAGMPHIAARLSV